MPATPYRHALEAHYRRFNRRRFAQSDPMAFLYAYAEPADREVVGLVASCLAYGRVAQIRRSVSSVLARLGAAPARHVAAAAPGGLARTFAGFRHRFTTGEELAALLNGAGRALRRHGSLEACFLASLGSADETVAPALGAFARELAGGRGFSSLLPDPARRSACKRLHLFLRWMVRRDRVDVGRWRVPARLLIVPLDTHMHKIARALGLTRRRGADLRTAIEVTEAFRSVRPDDPVRYDFCLTRLGIHPEVRPCEFLARLHG